MNTPFIKPCLVLLLNYYFILYVTHAAAIFMPTVFSDNREVIAKKLDNMVLLYHGVVRSI